MVSDNHYASQGQDLSEDQRKVLVTIQKLLNLAAKNTNPEEAASAAAKAQDLLLTYNLSSDMLDQDIEGGTRGKEQLRGGSREYERNLWGWVAELNFCFHWVGQRGVKMPKKALKPGEYGYGSEWAKGEGFEYRTQYSWHHFLIGRKANVAATIAMARYLQDRVDTLAMEFVYGDEKMRYSQRAMSFREGAVAVIVDKLVDRRRENLRQEKLAEAEARQRAEEAAAKGVSMETALTIATVTQNERDLNEDFMRGKDPGTTARERAARAAAARAAEQEYTRWAAAHPEEAAAQEKARREEAEKNAKRQRRAPLGRTKDYDPQAYYAGRAAGQDIGIDPQAGRNKVAGVL